MTKTWDCGCYINYVSCCGEEDIVAHVDLCFQHAEELVGLRADMGFDFAWTEQKALVRLAGALVTLLDGEREPYPDPGRLDCLPGVRIHDPGLECFHRKIVSWLRGDERVSLKIIWRESAEITDDDIARAVLENQHKAMGITLRTRWIKLGATIYLED